MFSLDNSLQIITIDSNYNKALYDVCSEVFYMPRQYDNKPYIGILITDGSRQYAVPLTSAKEKHKLWKNYNNGNFLVYETLTTKIHHSNAIITQNSDGTYKHILAALIVNKMIPIKPGVYSRVNINPSASDDVKTLQYKTLLQKEFSFCISIKDKILKEASKIYDRQVRTGKIYASCCDYRALEAICDSYQI